MFQQILRLSRQTLVYGAGNVVTRMVWFLLLPFFTHALPPDQFGVQTLYYILIALAMEIVRLGQDIALLRFYVLEKDDERRKAIFSTLFWAAFIFTTAISWLLWSYAEFWTRLIIDLPGPCPEWMIYTLKLCAGIILLDNIAAFPLVIMRAENQPGRFLSAKLSGVLVQTGMTLILLLLMGRGVPAIFEGNLIASAVTLLICMPTILSRLRFKFEKAILVACLAFGLPNVPNVIFVQFVELADRKILEILRGINEVGLYSAGYKLGMFLSIVATGFRFAWQPFFLQISDRPDAKSVYSRVLTYYLAIVIWLYLLLTAFVKPLVQWDIPGVGSLIDPQYWSGLAIFPIILLAHIFNGMYAVFMVGIYMEKKTRVLPLITGLAAIVNIGGNILLVPYFGMWACAWLTVVSYALMAGLIYVYIQRYYYVVYEWNRVFHLALTAGLIFEVGAIARIFGAEWVGYLLSILYPLALLASGLATPGERARLKL